ncbi:MAG: EAL domain-containing protein [Treponema sp.]|nr:EAL domain-containing protein [Treponema sp.]
MINPLGGVGIEPLTQAEKHFVSTHEILNVVCESNWPPFEYSSAPESETPYAGININLLEKMASIYGIKLHFIRTSSYEESIDFVRTGKADIITGYMENLKDLPFVQFSDEIYSIPLLVASSTGIYPPEGSLITHGNLSPSVLESIKEVFPEDKYHFETCSSPIEIIDRFRNGTAKYIIIGQFEISLAEDLPAYSSFPINNHYSQSFAFSSSLEKEVISIFNKAARSFSYDDLNMISYEVQLNQFYEKKLHEDEKRARNLIMLEILIIALCAVTLCIIILVLILKHKIHVIEYDDITPLHTYNRFKRNVSKKLRRARPNEYIILSLNINGFGFINDSIGFENGNHLLCEIANFFISQGKKGEKYCRFYADNFIFFIKNPGLYPLIEDRVYRMTQMPEKVTALLPNHYKLTFSSSVYYITNPSNSDITGMITKANLALNIYRNTFLTHRTIEYTDEMEAENNWNMKVTINMNRALENEEFEVYFQPKFRFADEFIVGAEALIRWNNPEEGLLLPGKFIPLFEHNGFIEKIDIYVFKKVCEFLDRWNKSGKDGTCPFPLTISFNLSRFHLYDPELLGKLTDIVHSYDIAPSRIEIELTESIVFDNQKRLVQVMQKLKEAGFLISVDDFGSGYSSLNLLKDIPADVIKLDKEFLSKAGTTPREAIIIESVIEMAKKLHMTTVAEGIETKNQSELLRNIGCDIAQGFFYAKPMPTEAYYEFLKRYVKQ